jgi:hypothetical protein
MRLPLEGFVKIQQGRLVWFAFDEIEMKAAPPVYASTAAVQRNRQDYSYLSANGVFFNQARYEKTGAFALEGMAYLPFNLQAPADLSFAGDGNFLAVLPDLSSFFQQTGSSGHLDLNLTGPYKNLTLRNSYLRFKDGFLKMSRIAPSAHDMASEAFMDERGTFINIFKLAGKIGDATLELRNQESPPPSFNAAPDEAMPVYRPLRPGNSSLHFGTILVNPATTAWRRMFRG